MPRSSVVPTYLESLGKGTLDVFPAALTREDSPLSLLQSKDRSAQNVALSQSPVHTGLVELFVRSTNCVFDECL